MHLSMGYLSTAVIFTALLASPPPQDRFQPLIVTDAHDTRMRTDVVITCREGCPAALFSHQGPGQIKLPPESRPGDWITLQITNQAVKEPEWVLISPWNGRVALPRQSASEVEIMVGRKGDKQILSNGQAVEAMMAWVLKETRSDRFWQNPYEWRQAVLTTQAQALGLTPAEVDRAIRERGRKAQDPYRQGVAALYEKNFLTAIKLLTQSYEERKKTDPQADTALADSAFFLGQALYGLRRHSEAVDKFRESISLRKGDAVYLSWLGISLQENQKYGEAEIFFIQGLEINEKALGKDHPSLANCLYNLAEIYYPQGRYGEAEPLFKRALEIDEKTLGRNHPSLIVILNNLANICLTQKRYDEAESLYQRALMIDERMLGKDHPAIVQSLDHLASIYLQQEKYKEAESLYHRALAIEEKKLGPDHLNNAARHYGLAGFYYSQGKYDEAELHYRRMIEIYENRLGKNHLTTAVNLELLAALYVRQEKYEKAEPLYRRIVETVEKELGTRHPKLTEVLENYANVLLKMGRSNEAERLKLRVDWIRGKTNSQ